MMNSNRWPRVETMLHLSNKFNAIHLTPPSNFTDDGLKKAGWGACDVNKIMLQFEQYKNLLESLHLSIHLGEPAPIDNPDAIYAYDSCLCLPQGAILLQSIKNNRTTEINLVKRDLQQLRIPIIGTICHPAYIDGGDILWLRDNLLAVGRSWRTNSLAVEKLTEIVQPLGIRVVQYDLSNLLGKEHCLHLMSVISMLNKKTALIYEPGMPIALLEKLAELSIRTISVPEEEWHRLAVNVLSIGEDIVIAVAGNPITKGKLQQTGFDVRTFYGEDLCIAGEGGPTCLTRFLPYGLNKL